MTRAIRYHRLTEETAELLLDAEVFDHPVDPAQLAAFVADAGHEMILAAAGGRVVGFASGVVLLHPDKPPAFFINEVGVLEEMRRRGIGRALCEAMIGRALERGCRGIWLATEADNAPARALYRSLAARESGDIVVYDWDGAMG